MDPVSRLLADREQALPRFAPWVVLALAAHGLCVAAAFWLSRNGPSRPATLPAVSVRIVRPQPARQPPAAQPAASQAPVARPSPPPAPRPEEPEPEPVIPAKPATSDDAMPTADAIASPRPTPRPAPPAAGEASGVPAGPSSGLSLGAGSGGGVPGIPADFQFTYYIDRMLALIEAKWYKPPVPPGTTAQVRYTILPSGKLEGIQLESSSGNSSFDRAVLRALYAANPLPPLPPAYRKPSLTVHLTFAE